MSDAGDSYVSYLTIIVILHQKADIMAFELLTDFGFPI